MKRHILIAFALIVSLLGVKGQSILSPDKKITLTFALSTDGEPTYTVVKNGEVIIEESRLGLLLKGQPSLDKGFVIANSETSSKDETWSPVWGEESSIRDQHNELKVNLVQPGERSRILQITFRVFNDGIGFRYEIPEQANLRSFIVSDELTTFNLPFDPMTFWIPGDFNSNEYVYNHTRLSAIDANVGKVENGIGAKTLIGGDYIQSPVMMKSDAGLYLSIFEAALYNYPAMHLMVDRKQLSLKATLAPDAVGNKAYLIAPVTLPWRTIIFSDKATDILASRIILNLNEPNKIANTEWIKPMKMIGIWWEMHVGLKSWNYSNVNQINLKSTDWTKMPPNGTHGATTENTKKYIDFAAENGIDGVLVEGWNIGWEDWAGNWKEDVFDFITPYPDFNVKEITDYARSKGVKMIMHHETSASATNYERYADTAFRFMKHFGYPAVKTGYVGYIIPRGEQHDGQWMINHYQRILEKAAGYKIMIDAHEPVRPTGQYRTWPNLMACEAARGNEFNAWSTGNPPNHETVLAFTRLLGGPMDYTPGIFKIKRSYYQPSQTEQLHSTLVKQLALYVTMYSPMVMAADLPENYRQRMDAFQFIKDVKTDWEKTLYLEAEPGEYITTARKAKNSNEWFIGAITGENARETKLTLSFLPAGSTMVATIYADAKDADWKTNPEAYTIQSYRVDSKTQLKLKMAAGGGAAISIRPIESEKDKKLKKL